MAEPAARREHVRALLATLVLGAVVTLAWTQTLDRSALDRTGATLNRALAAFAVARALNGVISVAQGTELAIQPVGVGVTLTVGEVLDPLNDLVENFSWLALVACVSLGIQMLLADVVVNPWINAALTAAAIACLMALWWPGAVRARTVLLRVFTLAAFARFLFALITLATAWTDQTVLAERQADSLRQIELAEQHIEALRDAPPAAPEGALPPDDEASVLERLGGFLDQQRQALDIRTQLDALRKRVEDAIEQLINLIVVFTVQTILVPVAALLIAYWTFVGLWRWALPGRA